jgi:lysophospholipase L1-like esterase
MRRVRRAVIDAALVLVAAVVAIALALWITPMQPVTAAGQTIEVGVTAPSWSLSGPGELDLFGQRIPTAIQFVGPVRPRVQLTRITLSQQLTEFARSGGSPATARAMEGALVRGWHHYFYWQIVVVAALSLVLLGAIAGWQRRSPRHTVVLVAIGLALTEVINGGAIMVTAYTAPNRLSQVDSLAALVGRAPILPAPQPSTATPAGVTVAVIGDSTAAGLGNTPLAHPDPADTACQRSADSYALDLASVNNWQVTNLACGGATVQAGLLGPQQFASTTVAAQLSTSAVAEASTIFVSIGANDVNWTTILQVCAVSPTCQDQAQEAYFQQLLASFTQDYLQLLAQLKVLPQHPTVVINLYYDPLTGDDSCLGPAATAAKRQSLTSKLGALNTVLANGAKAASFLTAQPNFTGHGVCDDQPYVQGLKASAPFHPTALGELAIALADEQALHATAPR